jgi:hypothetical protein
MPRRKRPNPLFLVARRFLAEHAPQLAGAPLRVHTLDGPPGAPRYAITIEACHPVACPHGVPRAVAEAGACTVRDCPLRDTLRLLLSTDGEIIQVTQSGLHWGK